MEQAVTVADEWTTERVETRLVAAFRALPGAPVFSVRARIVPVLGSAVDADPLTWAPRFVPERDDALALLTWARCRATGDSARECYRELKWSRNTAERARKRALAQIVAGLSKGKRGLDSGAKGFGAL